MQPLDPAGIYSDADVKAALRFEGGTRRVSFRYDLLSASNVYLGPLNTVRSCSVTNNALADIKRTAKFSIVDDGAINYLSDRIQPWARLTMADGGYVEWPQGVFLLSTPKRKLEQNAYVTRDVQAYDQLLALQDDKVDDRYTIASGTVYTTAITTLLDGDYSLNLTPTAKTLPGDLDWEPGTSKLRIVNDLLSAINYESASFDEYGRLVGKPYTSPADRAPEFTYATDSQSVIAGDVDQTLDLFSVPNKLVLIKSEPDQAALRSVYTNSEVGSPTSTVSRGRTIVEVVTEQDAADQTTLDDKAARLMFERSQVYEVVEFGTALMPMHSNGDVLQLTVDGLGLGAKYSEHEWSMDLKAGAIMRHKVRRVVSV